MTDQIPVKAIRTGSTVTALAEFEAGETIPAAYLPASTATGRVVIPFAFGDASPVPVYTPSGACTDVLARLVIDTPFNGSGAALKVGTSGSPELLIPASANDPTHAAGYEAAPDVSLTSGEAIVLTIIPGTGATQGAGRLIFDSI
jgi:hypothetical protein